MKNKLTDLNNHLFAQLERLNEEDIEAEKLQSEIERSKAVAAIAREIINNGKLVLDAQVELGRTTNKNTINMLGLNNDD